MDQIDIISNVVRLMVLASAIWVGTDSSRLGARRGRLGGGFLDLGPVAWFFAVLLFWIIALPCYLATRPKLVAANQRGATMATAQGYYGPAPMVTPPMGVPPQSGGQQYGAQPQLAAPSQQQFGVPPQGQPGAQPQPQVGAQPQPQFGAHQQPQFGAQQQPQFGAQPRPQFGTGPAPQLNPQFNPASPEPSGHRLPPRPGQS